MEFKHNTTFSFSKDEITINPMHRMVKNFAFIVKKNKNKDDERIEIEQQNNDANLADAIARVAEQNGLSANDVMYIFPLVLRMLKSDSQWAK